MPGKKLQEKKDQETKKEKEATKTEKELKKEETVDEKELLKEAEEREKEKKIIEAEAKKKAKEAAKIEAKEEHKAKEKKIIARRKPRHGKKYREIAKQIENKEYNVNDAIDLALKTNPAKFDATVEVHVKINPKEKNIRGMIVLAGGVVKEKKILEVTEKNIDEALEKIKAGKIDFDIMIAELKLMPKLASLAKILGPKGLMPSPKAGTAVENVAKAAEELKSGKVEYRADKTNIVHLAIGKVSFGNERIYQNYEAIINALPYKKIDSIYLTTTMGPSIKIAK